MYSEHLYKKASRYGKKKLSKILGKYFPDRFGKKIRNPVFVIGCGRSGTSMLTILLRNHLDICDYSEGNELWDPKGYHWYNSNIKRPPIWFDADKYIEVWRQYFSEKYKRQLKGVFGCYQHLSRRSVFLNKSPMNTFRIPDILEIFPDSKFIHIIRDGRAVSYSWGIKQFEIMKKHEDIYRKRGFYYPFNELVKYIAQSWIDHIEEVEKQKKKLNLIKKGILLEFTYEDFCANPEQYISSICRYLSLKRERFRIDDLSNIKSKNYKWRENLNHSTIREINKILMPTLKKIGQI